MQYYGIAWDFLFYRKDLVTLTRERIFPIKIKIEMRRAVLWIAFEDKAGTARISNLQEHITVGCAKTKGKEWESLCVK